MRIITAGLFAGLIPVIILVAVVTIHEYITTPGLDKNAYVSYAEKAGHYIGPVAGTLATLGMGFWAARKPRQKRILHGLLTGVFVILLDLAIFATPKTDFELEDLLVLTAKLVAGLLGGYLAWLRYRRQPPETRKSHRLI